MLDKKKLNEGLMAIGINHRRVNYGGCACVAVMLHKALQGKVKDMRLVSYGWCNDFQDDINEVRGCIIEDMGEGGCNYKSNWMEHNIGFTHVWLEAKIGSTWYALDADGLHMLNDMYGAWDTPSTGSFTIHEMQVLAKEDTWNHYIKRSQLPSIQRGINRDIKSLAA